MRTLPRSSRRKTTICANALRYCAAKDEKFYGFRGHIVVSLEGVLKDTASHIITGFSLTSANGSERDAVWDLIDGVKGLLIGDKGYLSSSLKRDLAVYGIELQTPKGSNMVDYCDCAERTSRADRNADYI